MSALALFSILLNVVLVTAVMLLGRSTLLHRDRVKALEAKPYESREPDTVCGCGHHFALHGPKGCSHAVAERLLVERGQPQTHRHGFNNEKRMVTYGVEKWDTVTTPCGCQRYVGPEPLPRYTTDIDGLEPGQ